jgi:hypothetical protein
MAIYERMGLPGCIGSTDVVHLRWDMCPSNKINICTGKEHYPTVAFQCTSDHHKKIMSVTASHFGSHNDKIIVRYDDFIHKIRTHENYFHDVHFSLFDSMGNVSEEQGVWMLSDNGEFVCHFLLL